MDNRFALWTGEVAGLPQCPGAKVTLPQLSQVEFRKHTEVALLVCGHGLKQCPVAQLLQPATLVGPAGEEALPLGLYHTGSFSVALPVRGRLMVSGLPCEVCVDGGLWFFLFLQAWCQVFVCC